MTGASKGSHRIPKVSGDEQDALSRRAKNYHRWRAGANAILNLIRERDDTLAALAVAREGAKDALASLVAAVSLLERGGKKAAASDKMFGMMLSDYKASIARTRAALKEATDGR